MSLNPGTRVGPYQVLESLGEGGMGVVYLARDERLARNVALKFVSPAVAADAAAHARLLREARTASALDHTNVATVYEVGDWNGQIFLAMAYYAGETLKTRIERGRLAIDEVASIAEQIARGLAAAHAAGIVHRDLKPSNILITPAGQAKILDFGLAKQVGPLAETALELTGSGVRVGTVWYMAPEQARGERVNQRADIWALGAVLFEMLTGRRPFRGDAVLTALLTETPPPVRSLRPDVPAVFERLVERALIKDPLERNLTADEVATTMVGYRTRETSLPDSSRRPSRRIVLLGAIVLLLAMGIAAPWGLRAFNRRWATSTALPEISRLAADQNMVAAFDLATEAERQIPADPELARLWSTIARPVSIQSTPAGAEISYIAYGSTGPWRRAGPTPLTETRLPLGWLRVKIEKAGFESAEDLVGNFAGPGGTSVASFHLVAAGTAPGGMVRAEATSSPFSVYVLGLELPLVNLNAFWIDRFEVSNRQFKAFVDAGGYRRREFWQQPLVRDGKVLSWPQAVALFVDATGRPGPAGWELGSYPAGQDALPVTGVSWYEAAAYATFAGKRLPTVYQWSWVADQPLVGFVIPFANFNSRAPVRADTEDALHRFGAWNLAGNVKEWTLNESSNHQRYILGGGWDEPPYMFSDADARPPFDRGLNFGFRCVKIDPGDPSVPALSAPIPGPSRNYAREKPVSDDVFAAYARLYSYDHTDLKAATDQVDADNPDWRMEKVTFAAGYGQERVIAYLFLPKAGKPPYQTLIFMPASNAWDERSSAAAIANPYFSFLMKSGRAALFPIYKGTYERGSDGFNSNYAKGTDVWRDHIITFSKDVARSVDYLMTRPDVDHARVGYFGISRGAALSPMMLAMEPRLTVAVLWLPGLYLEALAPEVDAINFEPRVKAATLVLSGRYDYNFPDETSSQPFFKLLGATAARKRRVEYDTGHNLPINEAVKQTLDWLDQQFGPVR